MLNIEQNDEDRTLEVSVSCDDCEAEIHPLEWIDCVHCRCGRASCDADSSDNHDGLGCFDIGQCECLLMRWSEYYIEALEIYFGQHPEVKGYKIVGCYESERFEDRDGAFDGVGAEPLESLKYAVADTMLEAAYAAGVPWALHYKLGPGERAYSKEFFLDWRYEIAGGCSLIIGLQEDRTVVVLHKFPDRPTAALNYERSSARAISFEASVRHVLRTYITECLRVGQDCFRLERSWDHVQSLWHSGFKLWGYELEEVQKFEAEQQERMKKAMDSLGPPYSDLC